MINDWCIIGKIYLYISYDGEKVSIANPESKKFWGPVQKSSESVKPPKTIDNTGSKVKIKDGWVYLEVDGKFMRISNLDYTNIIKQMSGATLKDGEATGVVFGFSQYIPDKTIMIFPGTELYKNSEDEYLRRINLGLYRKTTKYIPGNKYATESGDFYFIGKYVSHRGSDGYGYYDSNYNTNQMITVNVFSNVCPKSGKVSELYLDFDVRGIKEIDSYSSKVYPGIILFTSKSKPMVDMGKSLDIDISIEDSYDSRLTEFMSTKKKEYTYGSGQYYYTELSSLLNIFDLTSGTQSKGVSDKAKNMMKEIIMSNLMYILFQVYDVVDSGSENILKTNSQESNIKALSDKFFWRFMKSPVYYYNSSYQESLLKEVFELDLIKLCEEALTEYDLNPIPQFSDFDDYIKNIGYTERRDPETFHKIIDFLYVNSEKRKISEFLSKGPYRDLMVDIYKEAIDTNGTNLKSFNIENVGTQRTPLLKYTFDITLEDIMNHYGVKNLTDLPKEIKDDMTKLKIYKVTFVTRSDLNPELV